MEFSAEELNAARQRLFDRVIEHFLEEEGFEALFIQGSVASGSTDEFSDIDFRVVIQPELYERVFSERFLAPRQWGELIYNEWSDLPTCVSHFKPFNKVDVFYFKPEHLRPSPWYLLPTQVVYDPKGLVDRVIESSYGLEFTLDVNTVNRMISKGLAQAEEVYRRVIREELFYAQSLLNNFRDCLMQFDCYLSENPSSTTPSSHFEERGSQPLVDVLKRSYVLLEKQSILSVLGVLLKVYQDQVIKLHRMLTLQRNMDIDLCWIDTMIELCRNHLKR